MSNEFVSCAFCVRGFAIERWGMGEVEQLRTRPGEEVCRRGPAGGLLPNPNQDGITGHRSPPNQIKHLRRQKMKYSRKCNESLCSTFM